MQPQPQLRVSTGGYVTRPAVVGQPQMMQMGAPGAPATAMYTSAVAAPRILSQAQVGASPSVHSQPQRVVMQPGQTVPTYTTGAPTVIRAGQTVMPGSTVRTVAQPQTVTRVVQAGQQRPHTLAGPGYTQGAYETKHVDDPQLQNLKELKKSGGLKNVPVGDGLMTLKAAAIDGKLTRDQFLVAYVDLLTAHNIERPTLEIQNAVFDLFDRDDNGVVDMMEIICGISLLCSGSEDDKIHAVFNIFDENGDGYISMDEMFKFLTSVFKVVLTPNVIGVMNSMGVTVESAEDLASVTALECFKTSDLNHDGKLSVVEFKNWFYAPKDNPSFLFSPVRKLLQ